MVHAVNYAGVLRAIGQALDGLGIDSFNLENQGEDYVVTGMVVARPKKSFLGRSSNHDSPWAWLSGLLNPYGKKKTISSRAFVLRYTATDIERLEEEGRAKRRNPSGMPDAYSLPQLLRAIGGYMDFRGSRIVGITKQGQDFTLKYEGFDGEEKIERLRPVSLYGLTVRMYVHRSGRRGL